MSSAEFKIVPNVKICSIGEYDFVWNRIDIGVEEILYQESRLQNSERFGSAQDRL